MHIQLLEKEVDITLYNNRSTHPLQSWEWGEARKAMGIEVIRIGEFNSEEKGLAASLQNVYQITLHPLPHSQYKIGYIPRSAIPSKDLLNFIFKYAIDKH